MIGVSTLGTLSTAVILEDARSATGESDEVTA